MAACKSLSAAPAKKQSPGGRGARHHAWRAPRPAALAAPGGGRIRSSRARPSRLRARAITPFVAGGFAGLAEVRPYTQRRPALAQGVRIGATPLPIGHDAAFVQPGGATTLTRALMTPRAPGPIPVGLWSKMPETAAGTPSKGAPTANGRLSTAALVQLNPAGGFCGRRAGRCALGRAPGCPRPPRLPRRRPSRCLDCALAKGRAPPPGSAARPRGRAIAAGQAERGCWDAIRAVSRAGCAAGAAGGGGAG